MKVPFKEHITGRLSEALAHGGAVGGLAGNLQDQRKGRTRGGVADLWPELYRRPQSQRVPGSG